MHPTSNPSGPEVPAVGPQDGALAPWLLPTPSVPRRLSSDSLLGGGREVEIEHQGAIYRLKITSLGKLILTK